MSPNTTAATALAVSDDGAPSHFFTYGTFRRGQSRHFILTQYGAEFVAETTTPPAWNMLDCGSFPGLVRGEKAVPGEVYAIPEANRDRAWMEFDRIEGVRGGLFRREDVVLADGTAATMYVLTDRSAQGMACGWR